MQLFLNKLDVQTCLNILDSCYLLPLNLHWYHYYDLLYTTVQLVDGLLILVIPALASFFYAFLNL